MGAISTVDNRLKKADTKDSQEKTAPLDKNQ